MRPRTAASLAFALVAGAGCSTLNPHTAGGWRADRAHCLPVVTAPAGAYPKPVEAVCQQWNAAQAGAIGTDTGPYLAYDRCTASGVAPAVCIREAGL